MHIRTGHAHQDRYWDMHCNQHRDWDMHISTSVETIAFDCTVSTDIGIFAFDCTTQPENLRPHLSEGISWYFPWPCIGESLFR
jgi:hypothetical protein